MTWYVQILKRHDDGVEHEIKCGSSERSAEKTELGVNRNLNHEKFYTRLTQK